MPMGIISDDELEKEIENLVPSKKQEKVIDINRGRGPKAETPMPIRKFIAEEALLGTPVSSLVENFNISPSSISAYKNGATSTTSYHNPNQELKSHLDSTRNEISNTARGRLLAALHALDDEKLSKTKARDVAGIARDMSQVISNIEPKIEVPSNIQQVIVYKPRMKEEDDYTVITVNE